MTLPGKKLLESFDQLPDVEKREIASAILRRAIRFDSLPLSDEDLVAQADELFRELDARENSNG